jgi:hypothetical protein
MSALSRGGMRDEQRPRFVPSEHGRQLVSDCAVRVPVEHIPDCADASNGGAKYRRDIHQH